MKELKNEEILAVLRTLGIDSTSELDACLKEYKEYYTINNRHDCKKIHSAPRDDSSVHRLLSNRFIQAYQHIFPQINNVISFLKMKSSRKMKR